MIDGVITFEEFIAALSVSSKGTIDEKLDWIFSIYDIDDDGYITKEEMLNIVSAIYERKGLPIEKCNIAHQKVEQIFVKMDSNCDGKLSRKEFVDGFKNDRQILRSLLDKKYEDT
ncbi:EF hand-like protein [Leptotrombidium deliense]|uniref:EF hand-like protein n=1 Tax=Leptotrombidium deliense TaxID=299467 RepID=A0A443SAA2_9ACAR|nr:EF hand-like protein [Leptotrombidium deliense]